MMMEEDDSNTMRQDDTYQDKDIVLLSIVKKRQTFRKISCSFSKINTESVAETELVEERMTDQENIEQVKTLTVSQEEKVH